MKLISWNINGIRSIVKKGFLDFVREQDPDILCLQEIRAPKEGFDFELEGYSRHSNPAQKAGYSGTAIFSKAKPLRVKNGLGIEKHDGEGRVITAEYESFFLVNVYVPNSKRGLERLPYRQHEWDVDFLAHLKHLEKKKPVIFCGDMNVAHRELDLANPQSNIKNHGFTPQEREGFDRMIRSGFVDTFREFCTDGGHYTWWTPWNRCRERNIGWRIDYVCLSQSLRPSLTEAFILGDVMGSDHCPVGIETKGLL
ncbi:exodeoxyribonuclease III [Omnitrophica bacterium]|nr:exodeoxyribonuclease III [Candidatus Omnitrophota bacterium]